MVSDQDNQDEPRDEPPRARFITTLLIVVVVTALTVAHCRRDAPPQQPPASPPPALALMDKPDFRAIPDPTTRKQRFVDYLHPAVAWVNAELRERRARLLRLRETGIDALSRIDRRWLDTLAERYRVDAESAEARMTALERRLDTLPGGLVIAQAAIESGWGTSRFAREGNNLFGEWCFERGCGIVPRQRSAGASHEVRAFRSVVDSIRSYFRNLNSHPAYADLRARRAEARAAGREPSALALAAGLERYSERGRAYVEEVRTVIRANELDRVYAEARLGG